MLRLNLILAILAIALIAMPSIANAYYHHATAARLHAAHSRSRN